MRLKKQANNESDITKNSTELLNRIKKSCENIKDDYYVLLDNLNAIYSSYPNLYNEIKQIVKLPNDTDIKDISNLNNSMNTAVEKYLSDPEFLKNIIKRDNE